MLDLTRLQALVAFARTGSVSAAAEELHYSQPTVSHHLKRLEAETGAVLFRRVGRTLVLTDEGRRLANRGEEILGLVARAGSELASAVSLQTGHVRVAIFPSGIATLGPRLVTEMRERHPGLSLEVREAEPPEAEGLLLADQVDLAIAFTYPREQLSDAVSSEVLGEDPLYLVTPPARPDCATGHSVAARTPSHEPLGSRIAIGRLADFADDDWMAGCERCRGYLVATCEDAGFEPHVQFASDDFVAIQALIAVGHGVSMLPGLALAAHRHPDVVLTPVDGASRTLRLLSLGKPPLPPALDATSQVIREVVAAVVPEAVPAD
ncbi:LysR family transcriptional regulator [Demequina zhanjiangensis]|uniref:LysR substrate-binding domain-containing protein n=1 Tax=Demequina zhanjiangensis TaxID=3051659 RepID=A0ABT8G2L3_9MICO|nr:LysR substrate-binding domain-containing protein [Demequina sp. SYSU T00b26]MDN4473381.1 LysR substrate-binding domain-containing protein [Demequina sp. SYSU T00b26]